MFISFQMGSSFQQGLSSASHGWCSMLPHEDEQHSGVLNVDKVFLFASLSLDHGGELMVWSIRFLDDESYLGRN